MKASHKKARWALGPLGYIHIYIYVYIFIYLVNVYILIYTQKLREHAGGSFFSRDYTAISLRNTHGD